MILILDGEPIYTIVTVVMIETQPETEACFFIFNLERVKNKARIKMILISICMIVIVIKI